MASRIPPIKHQSFVQARADFFVNTAGKFDFQNVFVKVFGIFLQNKITLNGV